MARKRIVVLVLALLPLAGCMSYTPAEPLPHVNITTGGPNTWRVCVEGFGCRFSAQGKNEGPDCAKAVEGIVTFYDASRAMVGPGQIWLLDPDPSAIVRPGQTFTYMSLAWISDTLRKAATGYLSETRPYAVFCA